MFALTIIINNEENLKVENIFNAKNYQRKI